MVLLGGLAGISALSIDMSLPALPVFVATMHASHAVAQLTLTLYLAGFVAGQLVLGPASDRFGRRPLVLAGLGVYTLGGVMCALSSSIELLIVSRLVQGAGAAIGSVLVRAIVRDLYDRHAGTRALSLVSVMQAIAPIVAPVLGVYVLLAAGWHAIFLVLAATGALLWLASALYLHESLAEPDAQATDPGRMLANFAHFVTNTRSLGYMLIACSMQIGLFGWISSSPFVLTEVFGVPPPLYGWVFATGSLAFLLASAFNVRLLRGVRPEPVLRGGLILVAVTAVSLAAVEGHKAGGLPGFLFIIYAFFFAYAIIVPNAIVAALEPVPQIAGSGSSLVASAQTLGGSLASYLAGRLYDHTASSTALMIGIAATGSVLAYLLTLRRY